MMFLRSAPDAEMRRLFRDVVWIHERNTPNVGDRASCPGDYLGLGGEFRDHGEDLWALEGKSVIVGGGGLVHSNFVEERLERMLRIVRRADPRRRIIAWGLGANYHGETEPRYPAFLKEFDLLGIRDFGNPWHYIPCASCLHPAFDSPPPAPVHAAVLYGHYMIPARGIAGLPERKNTDWTGGFEAVVRFLASGETVITNSFHGAYWAQLLGRRVLLYKSFSNKFAGFEIRLPACHGGNWRRMLRTPHPAPVRGYLNACRRRNRVFLDEVRRVLAVQAVPAERV